MLSHLKTELSDPPATHTLLGLHRKTEADFEDIAVLEKFIGWVAPTPSAQRMGWSHSLLFSHGSA